MIPQYLTMHFYYNCIQMEYRLRECRKPQQELNLY